MQKLVQQRMKMLEGMPRLIGPMSVKISDVPTGTWRYHRPVIRHDDCVKCGICAEYCPCGVIEKIDNKMVIDYTYCKGCGICANTCPFGAITMVKDEK
jgi:pyruvate ferredoxin oxidoreductase delta subunit